MHHSTSGLHQQMEHQLARDSYKQHAHHQSRIRRQLLDLSLAISQFRWHNKQTLQQRSTCECQASSPMHTAGCPRRRETSCIMNYDILPHLTTNSHALHSFIQPFQHDALLRSSHIEPIRLHAHPTQLRYTTLQVPAFSPTSGMSNLNLDSEFGHLLCRL